jgi:hypothetical protein
MAIVPRLSLFRAIISLCGGSLSGSAKCQVPVELTVNSMSVRSLVYKTLIGGRLGRLPEPDPEYGCVVGCIDDEFGKHAGDRDGPALLVDCAGTWGHGRITPSSRGVVDECVVADDAELNPG